MNFEPLDSEAYTELLLLPLILMQFGDREGAIAALEGIEAYHANALEWHKEIMNIADGARGHT